MNKKISSKEKNVSTEDPEFGTELAVEENDAVKKVQEALFEMHNQAGIYNIDEE